MRKKYMQRKEAATITRRRSDVVMLAPWTVAEISI